MASKPGFFKRRGLWIGLIILLMIAWSLRAFQAEIDIVYQTLKGFADRVYLLPTAAIPPYGEILRAFLVLAFGLLVGFWATFRGGIEALMTYVLPVRTREERRQLYSRFMAHLSNHDAPAIFVRDGASEASQEKLDSSLRGVALVNVNSAIALETKVERRTRKPRKRTRVCGPGIVFKEKGETIYAMVDLRPQARSKTGVRGYTLDGIEIQTNLSVTFTIGQPPEVSLVTYRPEPEYSFRLAVLKGAGDGSGQVVRLYDDLNPAEVSEIFAFQRRLASLGPWIAPPGAVAVRGPRALRPEYDRDRTFKAIYSQPLDAHGTITRWSDLPVEYAANIFRNMLSREKYDALYEMGEDNRTRLEELQAQFNRVVQLEGMRSFQLVARLDGRPLEDGQPWVEAEMVRYPSQPFTGGRFLRNCGIKVISAGFSEPVPVNELILQQRLDNWRAYWDRHNQIARAEFEYQTSQYLSNVRKERQAELVRTLARTLNDNTYSQEAIAIQLLQALDGAVNDPATRRLLPKEVVDAIGGLRPFLLPEQEPTDEG